MLHLFCQHAHIIIVLNNTLILYEITELRKRNAHNLLLWHLNAMYVLKLIYIIFIVFSTPY